MLSWALLFILPWVAEHGGTAIQDQQGHIIEIDLTAAWINDTDLNRLAALPHLRKLSLSQTKITDLGLERLQLLRTIREFNCRHCEYITDDGLAHLKTWKQLEHLTLRGTKLSSKVFEHLEHLTSLRSLDLSHTEIEDDGMERLESLTHLERLAIGGNRLDGSALVALKRLPALRHLDVGGIQRVDSGLWGLALTDANLKRLGGLTALQSLSLSGANIADRGLDRPGHPEAERTDLRNLDSLAGLSNLQVLDLSRTPVLPSALAVLKSFPKLSELRLGLARHIDDAALAQLGSLTTLRTLYLIGSGVTPAAVEQFRARRPDCRVIYTSASPAP